jgi:hypothetical protein
MTSPASQGYAGTPAKSARSRTTAGPDDQFLFGPKAEKAYDSDSQKDSYLRRANSKSFRVFSAWLCLAATLLLYAPLAGAADRGQRMECCKNGQCSIPQHHHKNPAKQVSHDDCDHGSGGIKDCLMSCCQDSDHSVVVAIAFVVSPFVDASVSVIASGIPAIGQEEELPRSIEPASPPPRATETLR